MDIHTQNPLFHALDIILAYLNHGNSLPEIEFLSSAAETWCRHHLLPPAVRFANNNNNNNNNSNNSNNSSSNLDDVLWTHPHLFDLSIHSFARLYSFDSRSKHPNGGISSSSSSPQPPSLTQRTTAALLLSFPSFQEYHAHAHTYITPLLTAQHFFSAVLDAYTLSVGGKGRSFHDRIVAQDLRASPIIYYMPEVVRRIAALDPRELLTTQFSTFSSKTSLGFSCYLGKGFDIVMMDAPPIACPGESGSRVESMEIDGTGSSIASPATANPRRQRRRGTPRPQNQHPGTNRVSDSSPQRISGPQGTKRWPSGQSRGKQSRGARKKRRRKHE